MNKVIKFPVGYPTHQWRIRLEILRYMERLGWTVQEKVLDQFYHGKGMRWEDLDDRVLGIVLNYVQASYAEYTAELHEAKLIKKNAPQEPLKVNKVKRPVQIIPFPVTPEIAARRKALLQQQAEKASKQAVAKKQATAKKKGTAKTSKQAQGKKTRTAEEKRLTRQIKMVQRDCEKKLYEFSDEAYRLILQEQYGVDSSTKLGEKDLKNLLSYLLKLLRSNGTVKPSFEEAPALLHHDKTGMGRNWQMHKIQALLSEKGTDEKKYISWNYALGIVKRMTSGIVTDWEDATPDNLNGVIAALTRDAARKGRWLP